MATTRASKPTRVKLLKYDHFMYEQQDSLSNEHAIISKLLLKQSMKGEGGTPHSRVTPEIWDPVLKSDANQQAILLKLSQSA